MSAPVTLALETATDRLCVAVAANGRVAERELGGARRHASALLPLTDEALEELGARPQDIALVALSDGPGSFTGLRVGAAVAKAIVRTTGARLMTGSTLLVRAAAHAGDAEVVLAASNALRGEAYIGVWEFGAGGAIAEVLAPRPIGVDSVPRLPPVDRAVGEAPADLAALLRERLGVSLESPAFPSARALLDLVTRPGGARRIDQVAAWEPDYGRPAEAQVRWEQRHGRPLPGSPSHGG